MLSGLFVLLATATIICNHFIATSYAFSVYPKSSSSKTSAALSPASIFVSNDLEQASSSSFLHSRRRNMNNYITLRATAGEDGSTNNATENDVLSKEGEITELTSSSDGETDAAEDVVDEVDELAELKADITKLELEIKNKRRTLSYYNDMADDFTKSGYARKVAEMENMRRARSMLQSSNKFTATASTVTEFLPVLDQLEVLRETYGDDPFGKQYSAVTGAMKTALTTLGVSDYTISVGDTIDTNRMSIIESQYSLEYPKNTVVQVLSKGMELQGNIVRPAQCIASLGVEPSPDVEKDGEENDEDTKADELEEPKAAASE